MGEETSWSGCGPLVDVSCCQSGVSMHEAQESSLACQLTVMRIALNLKLHGDACQRPAPVLRHWRTVGGWAKHQTHRQPLTAG